MPKVGISAGELTDRFSTFHEGGGAVVTASNDSTFLRDVLLRPLAEGYDFQTGARFSKKAATPSTQSAEDRDAALSSHA